MTEPATLDKLTVYLRVSSDEQKQQGTIENQRREAERYLAAHDVTPYGWYANDGVSGKRMLAQRPEGQRLLADIAAGQVKTVLVCKLDRFGRTLRHMLDAVDQLTAAGCRLVSLAESFDTDTPAGRLQLHILGAAAEYGHANILATAAIGTPRLLESNTWMGGMPPSGYKVEGQARSAHLVFDETPEPEYRV